MPYIYIFERGNFGIEFWEGKVIDMKNGVKGRDENGKVTWLKGHFLFFVLVFVDVEKRTITQHNTTDQNSFSVVVFSFLGFWECMDFLCYCGWVQVGWSYASPMGLKPNQRTPLWPYPCPFGWGEKSEVICVDKRK